MPGRRGGGEQPVAGKTSLEERMMLSSHPPVRSSRLAEGTFVVRRPVQWKLFKRTKKQLILCLVVIVVVVVVVGMLSTGVRPNDIVDLENLNAFWIASPLTPSTGDLSRSR